MAGHEGQKMPAGALESRCREQEPGEASLLFISAACLIRQISHQDDPADAIYKRIMDYAGICVIYDILESKRN